MAGYIDMENWKRKNHYSMFSEMDYPFFNLCAPLDISNFYAFIKQREEPFFVSFLYLSVKAANQISEFRCRIRENGVYLHDTIHPSFTVLGDEDLFSFCPVTYTDDYSLFKKTAQTAMNRVKLQKILDDEPGRDDFIYITSIPWVSFTSISHPISMSKTDSVPRISWGKFYLSEGKRMIPMSVSVHHALADGLHAGRYFQLLQDYLDHPEVHLALNRPVNVSDT